MTAIEQEASAEPDLGSGEAEAGWGEAKLIEGMHIRTRTLVQYTNADMTRSNISTHVLAQDSLLYCTRALLYLCYQTFLLD